ncbi:MAG: AMP-binding protein [Gemmataceae bacterium]|nr:AMP-binding protein [Gemmataceae bacterium]
MDSLLAAVARSPFYQRKLGGVVPGALADFPFTTKTELAADQYEHPPYGTVLTRPLAEYTRLHQSSGTTTGRPLVWLDTPDSWDWLLAQWEQIYSAAGLAPGDRLFFAFSFGPFLGFWTAFEAARRSYLCLTGGSMTTSGRLRHLCEHRATVVLCTPTYALHLAEVAASEGIDLAGSSVTRLIVAGEPGGLIAATRSRIAAAWGAAVYDHYGLTEVGPVTAQSADDPDAMTVLDGYIPEVIDPETARPVHDGEVGELVLTNLGRLSSPLVRYRTGDLVRMQGRRIVGGVLGRADDMVHIRGNNIYPATLEAIVRRCPEVAEFQIEIDHRAALPELTILWEPYPDIDPGPITQRIGQTIRDELLFRPTVVSVTPGTLPRFEMKARRVTTRR